MLVHIHLLNMNQINSETKINAPKEKVWEVLSDFGSIAKWAPGVAHSTSLTAANKGVGCERSCEIPKVGSLHEKIIEWNEGSGYKYEVDPIPGTPIKSAFTTWSTKDENGQTVVQITSQYELAGNEEENKIFLEQTRGLLDTILAGLKQFIETGKKMEVPSQT